MDQASASPVASCAHNPAAPRTLPSWLPSEGQARTVVPSRDGSAPQSVPHSEPVHIVPRPSSPALCQSDAKGYLLPDYHSGATGIPGRFSEGLLLRRLQNVLLLKNSIDLTLTSAGIALWRRWPLAQGPQSIVR